VNLLLLFCLQFYARGLFGAPPVTWIGGPYDGWLGGAKRAAFGPLALLLAGLDQPLRTLSGGKVLKPICYMQGPCMRGPSPRVATL
jgi:hypothetical protein